MSPLDIGSLRHRIAIEQQSSTQNDFGEKVVTWSTYVERWARREAQGGSRRMEQFARNQKYAEADFTFTIRHTTGIDPTMRVTEGSRVFDIMGAVDPDGTRERMVLFTVEDTDST